MTPACEQELWLRYRQEGDLAARNRLVEQNLSLVHHAARRVHRRASFDAHYDDLLSAGTLGLLQAVERFDPAQGWRLSTFAMVRIQGAILDHLRQEAGVPRRVLARSRRLAQARARVEGRLGRRAREAEVAGEIGVPAGEYHAWHRDGAMGVVSLTPAVAATVPGGPQEGQDAPEWLAVALEGLPERERRVITLGFFEDLSGKEIAATLGISESRVSQLRNRALLRLRSAKTERKTA